jgi:hypothetical protein
MRLVKAGYGTMAQVRQMTSREVLQALSYEQFINDYQEAYIALNKAKTK